MERTDQYKRMITLWLDFIKREEFNNVQIRSDMRACHFMDISSLHGNKIVFTDEDKQALRKKVLREYFDALNDHTTPAPAVFPDDIYLLFPLIEYKAEENKIAYMPVVSVRISSALEAMLSGEACSFELDPGDNQDFSCIASVLSKVAAYEDVELDAMEMSSGMRAFVGSIADIDRADLLRDMTAYDGYQAIKKVIASRFDGRYVISDKIAIAHLALADYSRKLQKDLKEMSFVDPPSEESVAYDYLYGYTPDSSKKPEVLPRQLWYGHFGAGIYLDKGQADVMRRVAFGDRLISVEGPPGTGKTVLIQAIVASRIVDRAVRLTTESTFYESTGSLSLVTSDTARAVENVVKGLKEKFPSLPWLYFEGGANNKMEIEKKRLNETIEYLNATPYDESEYISVRTAFRNKYEAVKAYESQFEQMVENEYVLRLEMDRASRLADTLSKELRDKSALLGVFKDIVFDPAEVEKVLNELLALREQLQKEGLREKLFGLGRATKVSHFNDSYGEAVRRLTGLTVTLETVGDAVDGIEKYLKDSAKRESLQADIANLKEQVDLYNTTLQRTKEDHAEMVRRLAAAGSYHQNYSQYRAIVKENCELFELAVNLFRLEALRNKDAVAHSLIVYRDMISVGRKSHEAKRLFAGAMRSHLARISLMYPLFASTMNSVKNVFPMLYPDMIDLCILDEAVMTPCHKLYPVLYRSKRAVAIGDPHQLAAVISLTQSQKKAYHLEWQHLGFSQEEIDCWSPAAVTAYHRAAMIKQGEASRPELTTMLEDHRRCAPDIARLFLSVGKYERLEIKTMRHNEIDALLAESFGGVRIVAFNVPGDGAGSFNKEEAEVVMKAISFLKDAGVNVATDVGVISPFRRQERLIAEEVAKRDLMRMRNVGTVHKFQGQEYPVIVFSPAVCKTSQGLLGFLNGSYHLLNVAISRAQQLFVVVGNLSALKRSGGSLGRMVDEIYRRGVVFDADGLKMKPKIQAGRGEAEMVGCEHLLLWPHLVTAAKSEVMISTSWIDGLTAKIGLDAIRNLQARGVKIWLCYSASKQDEEAGMNDPELVAAFRDLLGNRMVGVTGNRGNFNRSVIIDGVQMITGNWNWLSNSPSYWTAFDQLYAAIAGHIPKDITIYDRIEAYRSFAANNIVTNMQKALSFSLKDERSLLTKNRKLIQAEREQVLSVVARGF